jgi:hypothetical protein
LTDASRVESVHLKQIIEDSLEIAEVDIAHSFCDSCVDLKDKID